MPVGEEYALDGRDIDAEALRIREPDVRIRTRVEQHRAFAPVTAAGDEDREAVTRTAQLVEGDLALMPFIGS